MFSIILMICSVSISCLRSAEAERAEEADDSKVNISCFDQLHVALWGRAVKVNYATDGAAKCSNSDALTAIPMIVGLFFRNFYVKNGDGVEFMCHFMNHALRKNYAPCSARAFSSLRVC